ncbi:MAG: tetratricopeptide repeat protein [Paracoccaceae bacterium]
MRIAIALLISAGPALAECPPAPDHAEAVAALQDRVASAATAMAARQMGADLWRFWLDAPDARAQSLLDEGMGRRGFGDLAGSAAALDALVAYCPDYAEGWNQRAFTAFLAQDYAAADADLGRALALNPTHTGALTGRAMSRIALGRVEEGEADILTALSINPWLSERGLLRDPSAAPPVPRGEDI